MGEFGLTRRGFLKATGASVLALSLHSLGFLEGKAYATQKVIRKWEYASWEDLFREEWTWDKVTFGTHLVDCYPGNCLWRVYTKEGIVWREEQAAKYPVVDPTGPDWNPRGCQKGCFYSHMMYNPDRVKYPLKRVGERGEGKWKRISWDEAATEVADAVLDAIEKEGPESIIYESGPGNGGSLHLMPSAMFMGLVGATSIDLDSTIGDFNKGIYETFGKFQFMDSCDGWYFGKLIFIWHMNPAYTRIPSYHFISEARYSGAEVISIAPDYNPSSIHSDEWVPIEPGGDAALALGMAQVLIEENLIDVPFIKEQTDFPFLIRTDTERFLRGSDMEEGGLEDQFYFYDSKAQQPVKAPRETLQLPVDPALNGTYRVRLKDGSEAEVRPSFAIFREQLNKEYTPEKASKMCGVPAETIRRLGRKAGASQGHVQILIGWNSPKYYHGDLIERAMCLVVALTGSLGKKGAGVRGWNASLFQGPSPARTRAQMEQMMAEARQAEETVWQNDPTMTREMVVRELQKLQDREMGQVPPVFLYYFHSGYRETWNTKEWHDPSMKRTFDEYMEEALAKGWWDGLVQPGPDQEPQVYIYMGTSPARKNRGWVKNIYPSLWQKYKFIMTMETRFSTTALMSDMILPAAGFYEKLDHRFPTPHVPWLTLTEQAVEPIAEAKSEWDGWLLIAEKLEQRAKERGLLKYKARNGRELNLENLAATQSMGFKNIDEVFESAIQSSINVGTLPEGSTLKGLKEEGIIRFSNISTRDIVAINLATDIKPDEPIVPLTWHTGPKKTPYPTMARRIQFYIDHEWFLEAGEGHPVHKDNPKIGGDYSLSMTSGHQRWSIHSIWVTDEHLLRTHQGRPFLFINTEDAAGRGIKDGDLVRVYNDFNEFKVHVKVTPAARPRKGPQPGQVIIYHAWEPYQFEGWKSYDAAIPGMIKWNDLAAGYGHLNYYNWNWCTQPIDRGVAVEVEKI